VTWADDADDVRPNANCSDCGVDYSKADHDPTTTCDACSDRRDQWADAFTARQMAKARPITPITKNQESVA